MLQKHREKAEATEQQIAECEQQRQSLDAELRSLNAKDSELAGEVFIHRLGQQHPSLLTNLLLS
jgi:septal ring factor EnvC (AmiA/AmiB activator)